MSLATHKKLSFEEYLNYHDGTDNRYEFDNGYLILDGQIIKPYNSPIIYWNQDESEAQELKGFPLSKHEEIIWVLCQNFNQEIQRLNLDWIARPSSIGIPTVANKIRIPDLLVCQGAHWRKLQNQSAILQDIPLLVVEVVSEGTKTIDYRYKLAEYQVIKISEYWIVDFLNPKITVLSLVEGLFERKEFLDRNQQIMSGMFPELELTFSQVLEV